MVTTAEEGRGGGSGGHLNGKYFNAEEEEAWDIASACMHLFFLFFREARIWQIGFGKRRGRGNITNTTHEYGRRRRRFNENCQTGSLSIQCEVRNIFIFAVGFFVGGNERVSESSSNSHLGFPINRRSSLMVMRGEGEELRGGGREETNPQILTSLFLTSSSTRSFSLTVIHGDVG